MLSQQVSPRPRKPGTPARQARGATGIGLVMLLMPLGLEAQTAPAQTPSGPVTASASSGVVSTLKMPAGKSTLLRLPLPVTRVSVGNPGVVDVLKIHASELYLLGKAPGVTNLMLWYRDGRVDTLDLMVERDISALQAALDGAFPAKGIQVRAAGQGVILSGMVENGVEAQRAMQIAGYFNDAPQGGAGANSSGKAGTTISIGQNAEKGGQSNPVINLLQVRDPQQVMLEVKVAEVSKTLLDKLGIRLQALANQGSWSYGLISNFLSDSSGILSIGKGVNSEGVLDAETRDQLVRILAEPNLMATSGQEASFLAGGRVFIPVPQSIASGGSTFTLQEVEFGVGLKFTPTVLENGRVNLRVAPEVSELASQGTAVSAVGFGSSILPLINTRRASTTVQLQDGQSFAIAGLIRNNLTETVKRFPILGELPVLGALFRSSQFQKEKTELLFVITPRLAKPLAANYRLPTDGFVEPGRSEFFLNGKLEGKAPEQGSGEVSEKGVQETTGREKPEQATGNGASLPRDSGVATE